MNINRSIDIFDEANIHALAGDYAKAIELYQLATTIDPSNGIYFYNYAHTLKNSGQPSAAIDKYKKAIELDPENYEAYNNLGNIYKEYRNFEESIAMYELAIKINPEFHLAYNNLGNALQETGNSIPAENSYLRAIELNNNYPDASFNLGNLLSNQEKLLPALNAYQRAFLLKPDFPFLLGEVIYTKLRMCDWSMYDDYLLKIKRDIEHRKPSAYPFSIQSLISEPELIRSCAELFQDSFTYNPITLSQQPQSNNNHSKIRLAYISSDFFGHNVAILLREILECHDREKFEIYGFSLSPIKYQDKILNLFTRCFDVSTMGDDDVVRLARNIEIDIAIDLNGLTKGCRPAIFKKRLSPIQINYLGYCGTTSCINMDFIIADEILIPQEFEPCYSEKVILLNNGCFPVPFFEFIDPPPSRSDHNLPDDALVFACFNNNYKITPEIFTCWMSLLSIATNSVLWLLEENEQVASNLGDYAESLGVPRSRIIFAPKLVRDEHINRLQLLDVYLDTYPCSAHTTARDILGVPKPIVTLAGGAFHSNVTSSLLHNLGAGELVARTLNSYQLIAQELALDDIYRGKISSRLRANSGRSSVRSSAFFTKEFEATLIEKWCANIPTRSIGE